MGAFSGTKVEELNFAANLIHDIDGLKSLAFQEFEITYKYNEDGRTQTMVTDLEKSSGPHSREMDTLKKQGMRTNDERLLARTISPENALTLGSFLITVGLFVWSLLLEDGVAALSIACMSLASTMTGLAYWWKPKLAKRPSNAAVPPGDLVFKTRGGAFVVVHCREEIARELYTGTDEVQYRFGSKVSKVFVGLGTLFLMVAVVLLGNCNWTMQAAIGATYLILNGSFWLASLLPATWCWHVSAYKIKAVHEHLPDHMRYAHRDTDVPGLDVKPSWTRTMWYAILRSKSTDWVNAMEAAPRTEAWREWIDEALKHALIEDRDWPAVDRKDYYMQKYSDKQPAAPYPRERVRQAQAGA